MPANKTSPAKDLNSPTIEDEQLNNDLVKQMKTCSSDYIDVETEICASKKIPEKLCAQRREKQKEKDMRTARFPEVLDQGGAENIAIGFDKTEDEKETRTAKFLGECAVIGRT